MYKLRHSWVASEDLDIFRFGTSSNCWDSGCLTNMLINSLVTWLVSMCCGWQTLPRIPHGWLLRLLRQVLRYACSQILSQISARSLTGKGQNDILWQRWENWKKQDLIHVVSVCKTAPLSCGRRVSIDMWLTEACTSRYPTVCSKEIPVHKTRGWVVDAEVTGHTVLVVRDFWTIKSHFYLSRFKIEWDSVRWWMDKINTVAI
jgi:hypothetical protein